MLINYVLTVHVPDEIAADIWEEILSDASAHDVSDEAKVKRYLGGSVGYAEEELNSQLPELWHASISETK